MSEKEKDILSEDPVNEEEELLEEIEAEEVPEEETPTGEAPDEDADPVQAELAKLKEAQLRTMAEFDNFRKRSQKEREMTYTNAAADTVARFLPVIDNFCRALETETADEAFKKGFDMIFTQFQGILESCGVTEIPAEGQPFDPELHNAVMMVEDDNLDSGMVAEVLQKGYILGDRVLRHSMVKVVS